MKKAIIITSIILFVILIVLTISSRFYESYSFEVNNTVTLLSVSEDGGDENSHVGSGYRIVKYYDSVNNYDSFIVVPSDFLAENGVLDLQPGDEIVLGRYTKYYKPGIIASAFLTFINIIDVKTPHEGNKIVIPFTKQIKFQEQYAVSKNSHWLKKQKR